MSGLSQSWISELERLELNGVQMNSKKHKQIKQYMRAYNKANRAIQKYEEVNKRSFIQSTISFFVKAFRRLFK